MALLIACALLLALSPATVAAASATDGTKPNIIILFGDDIGYGDLGSFGSPTDDTPMLDRMAREGAKLTQYYSAAAICSPSRASLMTGRHFVRAGIYPGVLSPLSNGGLPLSEVTLADSLRTVGYKTAMIGKWHLGTEQYLPLKRGFDRYYGLPMTQNECVSNIQWPGSAQPGHTAFGPCPIFNGTGIGEQHSIGSGETADVLNIDAFYDQSAESFIRSATAEQKPFFLYFSSHHTHMPQFAPPELINTTSRGLFGDSLAALDRSAGRLLDLLAALEINNNTLIVFTADNGGSTPQGQLGGHCGTMRCGKGTTYEGGHRVPALVWWPGKISAGSTMRGISSSLDWFATTAALAGFQLPTDRAYDSVDLSSMLFENKSSARTRFEYFTTLSRTGLFAVREGPYKLHMYTQGWGQPAGAFLPDPACEPQMVNRSLAPVMFNVELDTGEHQPVTVCGGDRQLPEPLAHPYCLSAQEFSATAARLTQLFYQVQQGVTMAPSETAKGQSPERFPCCNPACTPKPNCCSCT